MLFFFPVVNSIVFVFYSIVIVNRSFSLSRNKKDKLKTIQWKKRRNWDIIEAQYENAILVYLRSTPIWRPENSVNIWNLLWISRRLIISTEKTNIYRRTFPNALTSKRAQNQEISIYFSTNSIVAWCHAPP